jgi:hypothetical protein
MHNYTAGSNDLRRSACVDMDVYVCVCMCVCCAAAQHGVIISEIEEHRQRFSKSRLRLLRDVAIPRLPIDEIPSVMFPLNVVFTRCLSH